MCCPDALAAAARLPSTPERMDRASLERDVNEYIERTVTRADELVDELRGLVVDAEDMVEGLEELKKMEESIVANGGSMAVWRSMNDETSWDLPETFLSFFNEISSSDRNRKRLRVYDSPDDE